MSSHISPLNSLRVMFELSIIELYYEIGILVIF
jgi:hypothetical protein